MVAESSTWITPLREEMGRVIVGQGIFSTGCDRTAHQRSRAPGGRPRPRKDLGLEDFGNCISVRFKRLQFTPDMLPPTSSAP